MVERRRSQPAETPIDPQPRMSIEQLRESMEIRQEGQALDACLGEQPDLFFHAADGYRLAVAARDALDLDLDFLKADLAESFRDEALQNEEKITEAAITRKLALNDVVQDMERDLLRLRGEVDHWAAIKDGYTQRSFMLRELVRLITARMANLHLERSVAGSQEDLVEARRRAARAAGQ